MKKTTQQKGAVLLISIVVSSVVLAVGFGVYNRVYKELLFASFWKQTQVAFAAADAGLECALYWDQHKPAGNVTFFPTPVETIPGPTATNPFSCFGNAGISWLLDPLSPSGNVATSTFKNIVIANGCVDVTVVKDWNASTTSIFARGHNTCVGGDPRRVERGLRVDY
ncbi:MAG: hypothetical protein WAZ40_02330 [Minisyncoccia bacterium]